MKSKQQLKEELHNLIDSIDDEHVLNVLNEEVVPYVIQNRSTQTDDDLTTAQQQELEEAITEADRGETVSFEEFKASMDKWRTEYKSTNGSR